MFKTLLSVLTLTFLFAGCLKKAEDGCDFNPCSIAAPTAEVTAVKSYLDSLGITATRHCSGVFYIIDNPGSSKKPGVCNGVSVFYKGTFTNGSTFDQTQGTPFSSSLRSLIPGWKIGIPLIGEGGRIRLFIPPTLAYGSQEIRDANGNLVMPANSILIFDVTLQNVY